VNLTEWAHVQGIRVRTACRWYREGTPPVPARKAGRLILVSPQSAMEAVGKADGAALYVRVSSPEQRSGLDGRVARLSAWAAGAGLPVARVEAGAGSRVNGLRARVRTLLSGPAVTVVVAEYRDRLGRASTELVEAALSAHRRLVVLDNSEFTGGMAQEVTSLCARLAGGRAGAERGVEGCCAPQDIGPRAVKLQMCGGGV